MNAELAALMTEYHLSEKTMGKLFGVSPKTVNSWMAKPDAKNYRNMDRSPNKAKYKAKLKLMNRYLAKIRDV